MIVPRYIGPLLGAAAMVILVFAHNHAVSSARKIGHQEGYDEATQAMERKIASANAEARATEQVSQKRVQEAQQAYAIAMESLDARYRGADQSLRLCERTKARAAAAVPVPSSPGGTVRSDAPAAGDELPGAPAGDPRADLTALMRIADEQAQQLIACQATLRASRQPQ